MGIPRTVSVVDVNQFSMGKADPNIDHAKVSRLNVHAKVVADSANSEALCFVGHLQLSRTATLSRITRHAVSGAIGMKRSPKAMVRHSPNNHVTSAKTPSAQTAAALANVKGSAFLRWPMPVLTQVLRVRGLPDLRADILCELSELLHINYTIQTGKFPRITE